MSGIAIYEMNDFFFFNDTATTEIYTLSLHDALPILTGLAAGYNFKIRTVTRGYRIRAYPNGAQRRLLHRWFGAARWLWNTALEIRSEAYRECGLTLTGNDVSRWLTQWKSTPGDRKSV